MTVTSSSVPVVPEVTTGALVSTTHLVSVQVLVSVFVLIAGVSVLMDGVSDPVEEALVLWPLVHSHSPVKVTVLS